MFPKLAYHQPMVVHVVVRAAQSPSLRALSSSPFCDLPSICGPSRVMYLAREQVYWGFLIQYRAIAMNGGEGGA